MPTAAAAAAAATTTAALYRVGQCGTLSEALVFVTARGDLQISFLKAATRGDRLDNNIVHIEHADDGWTTQHNAV